MSTDSTLGLLVKLCDAVDASLTVEELRREPELHRLLVEAEHHCVTRLGVPNFGEAIAALRQSEAEHGAALEARRRTLWAAYPAAGKDAAFGDTARDFLERTRLFILKYRGQPSLYSAAASAAPALAGDPAECCPSRLASSDSRNKSSGIIPNRGVTLCIARSMVSSPWLITPTTAPV